MDKTPRVLKASRQAQMPQQRLSLWTAVAERSGDTALESFPIFKIGLSLTPEE